MTNYKDYQNAQSTAAPARTAAVLGQLAEDPGPAKGSRNFVVDYLAGLACPRLDCRVSRTVRGWLGLMTLGMPTVVRSFFPRSGLRWALQ